MAAHTSSVCAARDAVQPIAAVSRANTGVAPSCVAMRQIGKVTGPQCLRGYCQGSHTVCQPPAVGAPSNPSTVGACSPSKPTQTAVTGAAAGAVCTAPAGADEGMCGCCPSPGPAVLHTRMASSRSRVGCARTRVCAHTPRDVWSARARMHVWFAALRNASLAPTNTSVVPAPPRCVAAPTRDPFPL